MNFTFRHPLHFKILPDRKILHSSITSGFSVLEARAELKRLLGINLERGLFLSSLIHVAVIGMYYGFQYYQNLDDDAPVMKVRIMKYSDLGPPPSITNSLSTPVVGVASVGRPTVGMPVPVPDAEINPEQTIATQTEMSTFSGNVLGEGEGAGTEVKIEDDVVIENDEPGMNDFIPVEKTPQVVYAEKPQYPELARRANMEGFVWVKILVDKSGKPKKAVVIKESGGELFNEAAIAAAMKYQFTPAIMNSGAIQVWVAIKFNFQLTDNLK